MDAIKKLLENGELSEIRELLNAGYEPTQNDEEALIVLGDLDLFGEYLTTCRLSSAGLEKLIWEAKAGRPVMLFWYLENFYLTDEDAEETIYALNEEQLTMALIKKGVSRALELKIIASRNERLIVCLIEHTELRRDAEALLVKTANEAVLEKYLADNLLCFEGCVALCERDGGAHRAFYLDNVIRRHEVDGFVRNANDELLKLFVAEHELSVSGQQILASKGEEMLLCYIEKHALSDELMFMLFSFPLTDKGFLRAYFAKHELSPVMQGFLKKMGSDAYIKLYEEYHLFVANAEEQWQLGVEKYQRRLFGKFL